MTNFQTFTILKTLSHVVKNLPKAATVTGKLERKQILAALTQATRQASAPDPVGVTATPAAGDATPATPNAPPVLAIHEAPLPSTMPTVRPGTVAGAPVMPHVDIEVAE